MKKIIDANYFQDERLSAWLSSSRKNYAVLTDYGAIEAYKGDTLKSIFKSMAILSRFPNQVLILKGTQVVSGLRLKSKGLQDFLLDEAQTTSFREYCACLRVAERGDESLRAAILERGREATSHMDALLSNAPDIGTAMGEIAQNYSREERDILRTGKPINSEMAEKFIEHVFEVAARLFIKHPKLKPMPQVNDVLNSFIFRYSLCAYLLTLKWISDGGTKGVKPSKIRNDIVDMNYVAYATYYDGLLSNDKKANSILNNAKYLIENMFNSEQADRPSPSIKQP